MKKGSVTVLLSMIFPLIIALVLTLIEAARFGGVRLKATDAGNAAVDSVLAGYNRNLLDEYGLLFYDGSFGNGMINYEEIENEFLHYFEENSGTGGLLEGGSLYPIKAESAEIANIVTATDYNGGIFVRSALDYFKYDMLGELTETIKGYVEEISKGDEARNNAENGQNQLEGTDWGSSGKEVAQNSGIRSDSAAVLAAGFLNLNRDLKASVQNVDQTEEKRAFDQARLDQDIANSPIGSAEKAQKGGWISLVLPANREVSAAAMDQEEAPSHIAVDNRDLKDAGFLSDASNIVLFNEYLMKNYTSFSDNPEKSGIKYEIEYLIFGYEKDSVNLGTALNRIMWIREGINLLYLMSSDRKAAVKELATAMFSWTENPLIIELAAVALMAAWAYGEAILDVRALLDGKKVDLIKTDENWMLSYDNLPDLFQGARFQTKESKNGLSYEDYLRILLYLTDIHKSAYRAMDLIQARVRESAPSFLMSSQIYALEFRADCTAKAIFALLPVVKNHIRSGTKYRWEEYFSEVY